MYVFANESFVLETPSNLKKCRHTNTIPEITCAKPYSPIPGNSTVSTRKTKSGVEGGVP